MKKRSSCKKKRSRLCFWHSYWLFTIIFVSCFIEGESARRYLFILALTAPLLLFFFGIFPSSSTSTPSPFSLLFSAKRNQTEKKKFRSFYFFFLFVFRLDALKWIYFRILPHALFFLFISFFFFSFFLFFR